MKYHVSQKRNDGLKLEGTQKPLSSERLSSLIFRRDQDRTSCLQAVIEQAEQQRSKFEQSFLGRIYLSHIDSVKRSLQCVSEIQNP